MWSGVALVSGLSDTHSERWARMRILLRPLEVLGAIADDSAPAVAVRRLLLLGCAISLDAAGDSVVSGPAAISRPVVFKPCGSAPARTAFHAALLEARGLLPPPCLVFVTTTSSVPRPTPSLLSFAANKHRAVIVVQPVVALGLEGDGAEEAGSEVAGSGGVGGDGAAGAAPLVKVALPAGKPSALYLKVGKSCQLLGAGVEHAAGAVEVAPVRAIYRVSALLGLLQYKAQGKAQRLRVRAVELENASHVERLFGGLSGGAAGAPLPAAPIASHAALRAKLVQLRELLARPRSVALPALVPAPLQLLVGEGGGAAGGGGGGAQERVAGAASDPGAGAAAPTAAAAGADAEAELEERGREEVEKGGGEKEEDEEEEEEEKEENTEAWSAEQAVDA